MGCTTRSLRTRIGEHHCNTNNPNVKHISNVTSYRFRGIERLLHLPRGGDREKRLLRREAWWNFRLKTRSPQGVKLEMGSGPACTLGCLSSLCPPLCTQYQYVSVYYLPTSPFNTRPSNHTAIVNFYFYFYLYVFAHYLCYVVCKVWWRLHWLHCYCISCFSFLQLYISINLTSRWSLCYLSQSFMSYRSYDQSRVGWNVSTDCICVLYTVVSWIKARFKSGNSCAGHLYGQYVYSI